MPLTNWALAKSFCCNIFDLLLLLYFKVITRVGHWLPCEEEVRGQQRTITSTGYCLFKKLWTLVPNGRNHNHKWPTGPWEVVCEVSEKKLWWLPISCWRSAAPWTTGEGRECAAPWCRQHWSSCAILCHLWWSMGECSHGRCFPMDNQRAENELQSYACSHNRQQKHQPRNLYNQI